MGKTNTSNPSGTSKPRRPALTPEARLNQVVCDAMDLAESQIRAGTASSQVLTYFLKIGHEQEKNRLELEKLREENALLRAKTSAIESEKDRAIFYREVIDALTSYRTESLDEPIDPYVY